MKSSPVPSHGRSPSIGLEKKGIKTESSQVTDMKSLSKESKLHPNKKCEDKSSLKINITTSSDTTTHDITGKNDQQTLSFCKPTDKTELKDQKSLTPSKANDKSELKDQKYLTPSKSNENLNLKKTVIPVVSVSPPPCLPSPIKSPLKPHIKTISSLENNSQSLRKEDTDKNINGKEVEHGELQETYTSFKEEAPSLVSSSSYSSQEALLPPSPPEVSTPVHLKGCIKTVKRQPKGGWL